MPFAKNSGHFVRTCKHILGAGPWHSSPTIKVQGELTFCRYNGASHLLWRLSHSWKKGRMIKKKEIPVTHRDSEFSFFALSSQVPTECSSASRNPSPSNRENKCVFIIIWMISLSKPHIFWDCYIKCVTVHSVISNIKVRSSIFLSMMLLCRFILVQRFCLMDQHIYETMNGQKL